MKLPILILAMLPVAAMAWRSVGLDAGVPVRTDGETAAVAVVSEDDGAPARYIFVTMTRRKIGTSIHIAAVR